jgi:hypothetical protein
MPRTLTALLAAVAVNLALASSASADEPRRADPSIKGTWVGHFTVVEVKVKITATFKADGKYKSVMENGNYVTVETGTYTYSDGVLKTEPEGGLTSTFTVKFDGENTATFKGAGLSITCKRQ